MDNNTKTSFGFKTVTKDEKTSLVKDVFSRVASRYDLMNDVMSAGVHRLWKNELIEMIRPRPDMHLIDMAGGTGDIAFRFLNRTKAMTPQSQVTVCDINEQMLFEGKRKAINNGILQNITWNCCDATNTPFPDNTFDAYTISFGLRNVTEIAKAIQEAHRILKPGGQFFCLEFSKVKSNYLAKLYNFYSFEVIPKVGGVIANDKEAYQYLVESIEKFPNQEDLAQMITDAGFSQVSWRNMSKGIVAIHSGTKVK